MEWNRIPAFEKPFPSLFGNDTSIGKELEGKDFSGKRKAITQMSENQSRFFYLQV